MATITGVTRDREGRALAEVSVELKDERFATLYRTASDGEGRFALRVPDGAYPFLTAVRDYADRYLEYWAQNVPAYGALALDIQIDTLEVYGLHAFTVKGGAGALCVYFRPMSLARFRRQEADIAPELDREAIEARVNGLPAEVYAADRVREYAGQGFMTAYLLQVSMPDGVRDWERVDLRIRDGEGRLGCATLFREGR